MVDIRPNQLPPLSPLEANDVVIVDQGSDGVRQGTSQQIVDFVAPVVTQAEAVAGSDNVKRMTSLRTKQSIASEVGITLASNSQGAKADSAVQSVNSKTGNSITITKSDVGLGNVDNTSDASKPISTATQAALNGKAPSSKGIPDGGATGQVLSKKSNVDNDVEWSNAGTGDMSKSVYDPESIEENVFQSENSYFNPLGAPSLKRSVGDKLRDYCSIEDYGGGVNKTGSENLAAFNLAQSSIKSYTNKGAYITLRGGEYKQSGTFTLTSGVTLEGSGADNTVLVPEFTSGSSVSIGDGVSTTQHSNARGFSIAPSSQMQSGALIRFQNHFFCEAENIRMANNVKWGVAIDNGAVSYIAKLKDIFVNGGEFGLTVGNQGVGDVQNIDVVGCQFGQQTSAGIALFNVGGIFIDTTECLMCNVGLFTYPDVNSRVLGMRVGAKVYFDTCTVASAQVYSNGGKVTESQFNGTWFSSTMSVGGVGVDVGSAAGSDLIRNVNFVGATFTNNRGAGIRLNACQDIHLIGVDAVANGMEFYHDGVTRAPGIQVLGGASNINIVGGRSGKSGNFDFNYQDYGIGISSGASGVNISGVDVRGNAVGGVADQGVGTTITSSPGCKTSAHGTFLFPSGVSSHTVNHGLAFQPTYGDINVTVAGILSSSGISGVYVTATTATTITFSADTNLTSPINVVWSARVKE